MWDVQVKIVPVIIGMLGVYSTKVKVYTYQKTDFKFCDVSLVRVQTIYLFYKHLLYIYIYMLTTFPNLKFSTQLPIL